MKLEDVVDRHEISDECETWPHCTIYFWVTCPWSLKNAHNCSFWHDRSQVSDRCPIGLIVVLRITSGPRVKICLQYCCKPPGGLCGYAGWSAPLLFAYGKIRFFSWRGSNARAYKANVDYTQKLCQDASWSLLTRKNPKISDTRKFIVITLKVEQDGVSLEQCIQKMLMELQTV